MLTSSNNLQTVNGHLFVCLQSNEVGGSSKLELNGSKRAITVIEQHGINFEMLETDRHGGVKKYMRGKHSNKEHRFDAFHVAKCEFMNVYPIHLSM